MLNHALALMSMGSGLGNRVTGNWNLFAKNVCQLRFLISSVYTTLRCHPRGVTASSTRHESAFRVKPVMLNKTKDTVTPTETRSVLTRTPEIRHLYCFRSNTSCVYFNCFNPSDSQVITCLSAKFSYK